MIWLTWRQFRVEALVAVVALAAVAVVLGVTNSHSATITAGGFLSHDHHPFDQHFYPYNENVF